MRNMPCNHYVISLMLFCVVTSLFAAEEEQLPQQVKVWQKTAQENISKSDLAAAAMEYQKIIQAFPNTASAAAAQAEIVGLYIQAGNARDAKDQIDRLWAGYSNCSEIGQAAATVAKSYLKAKQPEEAIAVCNTAMELPAAQDSLFIHKTLIAIYLETNRRAQADEILETLMTRYSGCPNFNNALYGIAEAYRSIAKDPAKGRQIYSYWLDKNKSDPGAFKAQYCIVKTYLEENNIKEANVALEVFKRLCNDKADVFNQAVNLADAYKRRKCPEKSIELYMWFIETYPKHDKNALMRESLIHLYLQRKERTKADAALEKLMSECSDNPAFKESLYALARHYRSIARDTVQGRSLYTCLLERYGNDEDAWRCQNGIAKTYLEEGDISGTDLEMDRLLNLYDNPGMIKQTVDVGWTYLKKFRRPEKVIAWCDRLFQKFPDTPQSVRIQGLLVASYLQKGKDPRAEKEMDVFLKQYSNETDFTSTVQALSKTCQENKQFAEVVRLQIVLLERISNPKEVIPMMAQLAAGLIQMDKFTDGQAITEDMQKKFATHPEVGNALGVVAHAWLDKGEYDRASLLYDTMRRNCAGTRNEVEARMGKAVICLRLGQHDKTNAEVEKLIADANQLPGIDNALFEIGEGYFLLANQFSKQAKTEDMKTNCHRAIAVWKNVINTFPKSKYAAESAYYSGIACDLIEDYEKAITYFQAVADKWPGYPMAWNAVYLTSRCYLKLNEKGLLSTEELEGKQQEAYKVIITNYRHCEVARTAKRWLGEYHYRNQGNNAQFQ